MMRAAIVGLGWWGKTLVEAVSGGNSDKIQFVAATTRSLTDDAKEFSQQHNLDLPRHGIRLKRISRHFPHYQKFSR